MFCYTKVKPVLFYILKHWKIFKKNNNSSYVIGYKPLEIKDHL